MQLQEIPQENMSRLRWHHFTKGNVSYKGVIPMKSLQKSDLSSTELIRSDLILQKVGRVVIS